MSHRLLFRLLALASLLLAAPAWACGGFFCNLQSPVNQAAERVLYVQDGAQITVHIQISYQGPSTSFSWVLPLQSVPALKTGSDGIFNVLESATRPTFNLTYEQGDASCHFPYCEYAMAGGVSESDASKGGTKSGVVVLQEANVGPYESKVIQGSSGAELQKWLTDNGYDQPAATAPLLDAYAKQNYVFLALRLQKDKSDGDLVPIVIQMQEPSPCLPIRLTQLAANPDMPVIIWTMGPARAVPKNWLHVELNWKTIDWMTAGGNYLTVASKAIDQASGHAFITELAQKAADLPLNFAVPGWNAAAMAAIAEPGKYLNQLLMTIGNGQSKALQPIIKQFIPKPAQFATATDQEFYGCVQQDCCYTDNCGTTYQCYDPCKAMKIAVAAQPFDAKAMTQAIVDGIVQPLTDVQAAYAKTAYLTRLMTLISPEEMNKDPIFAWNKDLPAVSATHTAKAKPICQAGGTEAVRAEMTMADGTTYQVPLPAKKNPYDCFGPYSYYGNNDGKGPIVAEGGQPAEKVEVLDESGPPIEVDPSIADKVDAQLNDAKLGQPSLPADFIKSLPPITWNPDQSTATAQDVSSGTTAAGGCTAGPIAGSGAVALLFAGAVLLVRRRALRPEPCQRR